jgi:hypothetical protein
VSARILLASFVLLALPAAADMYKWVDEKGVTHYSESPPPEGTQSKKLELSTTPPNAPAAKAESAEDWKAREIEFRRRRLQKENAEETEKTQGEHSAAARKGRCVEARRRLDLLGAGRPLYRVNEKGERVYMEEPERATQAARWQKEVGQYCDS